MRGQHQADKPQNQQQLQRGGLAAMPVIGSLGIGSGLGAGCLAGDNSSTPELSFRSGWIAGEGQAVPTATAAAAGGGEGEVQGLGLTTAPPLTHGQQVKGPQCEAVSAVALAGTQRLPAAGGTLSSDVKGGSGASIPSAVVASESIAPLPQQQQQQPELEPLVVNQEVKIASVPGHGPAAAGVAESGWSAAASASYATASPSIAAATAGTTATAAAAALELGTGVSTTNCNDGLEEEEVTISSASSAQDSDKVMQVTGAAADDNAVGQQQGQEGVAWEGHVVAEDREQQEQQQQEEEEEAGSMGRVEQEVVQPRPETKGAKEGLKMALLKSGNERELVNIARGGEGMGTEYGREGLARETNLVQQQQLDEQGPRQQDGRLSLEGQSQHVVAATRGQKDKQAVEVEEELRLSIGSSSPSSSLGTTSLAGRGGGKGDGNTAAAGGGGERGSHDDDIEEGDAASSTKSSSHRGRRGPAAVWENEGSEGGSSDRGVTGPPAAAAPTAEGGIDDGLGDEESSLLDAEMAALAADLAAAGHSLEQLSMSSSSAASAGVATLSAAGSGGQLLSAGSAGREEGGVDGQAQGIKEEEGWRMRVDGGGIRGSRSSNVSMGSATGAEDGGIVDDAPVWEESSMVVGGVGNVRGDGSCEGSGLEMDGRKRGERELESGSEEGEVGKGVWGRQSLLPESSDEGSVF